MRDTEGRKRIQAIQDTIIISTVRSATHHFIAKLRNEEEVHIERFTTIENGSIIFLYGAWIFRKNEMIDIHPPAWLESIAEWLRDTDFTGATFHSVEESGEEARSHERKQHRRSRFVWYGRE